MNENKEITTNFNSPSDVFRLAISNLPKPYIAVVGNITKKKGYTKISDEENDITVNFTDISNYPEGSRVEVFGYLNYRLNSGGIYPVLNATKIRLIEQTIDDTNTNNIKEIVRQKTNRGFTGYLASLVKKYETIYVLIIHGQNAQVHRDFENALITSLGHYKDKVKLEFEETRLNDDDLSETLAKIDTDSYHLVFILRGGGSEQELARVGGIKSVSIIAQKDIPLYLALGHSLDRGLSLLEKVADYTFSTPSIAGQETGKLLRLYFEEEDLQKQIEKKEDYINYLSQQLSKNKDLLKNAEISLKGKLQSEIKVLEDRNKELQNKLMSFEKQNKILYVLVIALIIGLIFSLFR